MKVRRLLGLGLCIATLGNLVPPGKACGPGFVGPIFVFTESPDLPFTEYAQGTLGIVRSTFGRKTLFIAYRYLNGGSFTAEEQAALVEALRGEAPEDSGTGAIKAWIAARKEIAGKEDNLPEIYADQKYGGYDFFPNCTRNAFEVATATLKDRVATHGAGDRNVQVWLRAQDLVFQNCDSGGSIPVELGAESPVWLRKDRDYQIGAALLYSLNFDEARTRFARIAADSESVWQATAEYLVGRTLVRQASLTDDQKKKKEIYELAESHLQILSLMPGQFSSASQKLLALVKYRSRPEERVRELAGILANQGGNENLKQDLIDYVWLLDKFEDRLLKEEEKRRKEVAGEKEEQSEQSWIDRSTRDRYQAVQRGELINITWSPRQADGKPDYSKYISLSFKFDATKGEVLQAFAEHAERTLTLDEVSDLDKHYVSALEYRKHLVSPNRKFARGGLTEHEGCYYDCDRLTLDSMPDFLRGDDLSDWIFTFQTSDPKAYLHALAKWRQTESHAWLAVALDKAERTSPRIERLMLDAERLDRSSPAFHTAAYNLVRLNISMGRTAKARKMLDEIISSELDRLPVSTRNKFLEQRMRLAEGLSDFLRFAQRKAAAFYDEGSLGTMHDLLRAAKGRWWPDFSGGSREEHEHQVEQAYAELLLWDSRFAFDEETVDILNWHFPLEVLADAARSSALPDYLRRQLVLAVWARAILLRNDEIGSSIAPEVMQVAPEMQSALKPYLNARTPAEKEHAALFVLLKFPSLSPLVTSGIPQFSTAEEIEYYFESSWWCKPSSTEYSSKEDREMPKTVAKPSFLSPLELETARRERAALTALGDGKSYLGKRVLEWAKNSSNDEQVPEALFIAARANESYKYGCNSWDHDRETLEQAATLLRERYPQSPWTAKLAKPDQ